ncbi:unnamed protein product [Trichogramma brassicae]|uniref:tRNA synthetases class I catalytic domain-containing protein n=1 Tax=Trichogramma brassicae TaxID=86971 RepID=A0A6H5I3H1_9HYME|nr:unnamed protein product [Trichogramma brassicae]
MAKRVQPAWNPPERKNVPVLKLYNSLTRQKEEFVPQYGNRVLSYISFDIMRRILQEYFNYDVLARQNHLYDTYINENNSLEQITKDVAEVMLNFEEKIRKTTDPDKKCMLEKMQVTVLKVIKDPLSDWLDSKKKEIQLMNILFSINFHKSFLKPNVLTRVSEYVPEIVAFIEKIIDNGFAYESNGSVYFDVFLHSGHLTISGCKMSKSLKNFITIKEALKKHTSRQLRLAFLLHSWKDTLDYGDATMEMAVQYENVVLEKLTMEKPLKYLINGVKWELDMNNTFFTAKDNIHAALWCSKRSNAVSLEFFLIFFEKKFELHARTLKANDYFDRSAIVYEMILWPDLGVLVDRELLLREPAEKERKKIEAEKAAAIKDVSKKDSTRRMFSNEEDKYSQWDDKVSSSVVFKSQERQEISKGLSKNCKSYSNSSAKKYQEYIEQIKTLA